MSLVAFIIFFALIAVPVNPQGETRAYLVWKTLSNAAHLKYGKSTASSTPQGAAASSPFDQTTITTPSPPLGGLPPLGGKPPLVLPPIPIPQQPRNVSSQGIGLPPLPITNTDLANLNLFGFDL